MEIIILIRAAMRNKLILISNSAWDMVNLNKNYLCRQAWWHMPVIIANWEIEAG